jgi:hypothetical protein
MGAAVAIRCYGPSAALPTPRDEAGCARMNAAAGGMNAPGAATRKPV